ncbi:MAG TPA: hypothetical protein VHZ24_13190 [Pirellulales bacterium]|jgi:streptogramin lyase|nr:hypothetical protein [Pirellulales bacterium]
MRHLRLSACICGFFVAAAAQAGMIDTVAGTGNAGNNGSSGVATEINIDQPFGVEIGRDGALYVTEVGQHRVRRVDLSSDELTTVAGSGIKGYAGDGGPATEAQLNEPYEVRFDSRGNMLFVEMKNNVVRRVDRATGRIATIAGTGKAGYSGDGGPATHAALSSPHSIALDTADNVYIADIANHRVRRVDAKTGVIDSIAGNGEKKLPQPGPARNRPMFGPRALCIDQGTLWIALREGNSVWKMNLADGRLAHVAGTGKKGFSGDGGPAAQATFDGPKGIALDPRGNVFVVDTENQVIRKIDPRGGTIVTVAGIGPQAGGYGGDGGPATKAKMDRPHGIGIGPDGTLYIGDTNNHRVRRVRP